MLLRQLLENVDYEQVQGDLDIEITTLVYDSRKVEKGSVFVCISGTAVDAHQFIPSAVEAGAAAVIVEKEVEAAPGVTVVRTPSARSALAKMSYIYFGRPTDQMITVGVTGTKGKTTTTHMMKAILEQAGKKVGMVGTNGAYIDGQLYPTKNTTPESYELMEYFRRMADAGCQYMIMEVSSQGIMMHRVDGMIFDYGVFTNISPDHIGPNEHKDFEEYLYYKSQMLKICRCGIANMDDEHFSQVTRDHCGRLYTYGINPKADLYIDHVKFLSEHGFLGIGFDLEGMAHYHVRVNIPGMYNAYNALAAICLAQLLGIDEKAVQEAMNIITVNGRMELVYAGDFSVIVDYAHNAVSMESLLTTLRAYQPKRLVCVFGCGGNRSKLRRYDMGEIGGSMADLCVITADNSRWEKVENIIADIKIGLGKTSGKYIEIPDRREAISYSIQNALPGDMIVIIGKGHEDYQEIEGVRYPFLDSAVARECLEERLGRKAPAAEE